MQWLLESPTRGPVKDYFTSKVPVNKTSQSYYLVWDDSDLERAANESDQSMATNHKQKKYREGGFSSELNKNVFHNIWFRGPWKQAFP